LYFGASVAIAAEDGGGGSDGGGSDGGGSDGGGSDGGGSDGLLLAVGALGVRALSPRVYLYSRTAGA
jgi:hypothetical protein